MDVGKLPNHVNTVLCVIVFLWRVFSLIFVSHGLGIRFNSLQEPVGIMLLIKLLTWALVYRWVYGQNFLGGGPILLNHGLHKIYRRIRM